MLVQALDRFKISYLHISTSLLDLSPLHVYHCTLSLTIMIIIIMMIIIISIIIIIDVVVVVVHVTPLDLLAEEIFRGQATTRSLSPPELFEAIL